MTMLSGKQNLSQGMKKILIFLFCLIILSGFGFILFIPGDVKKDINNDRTDISPTPQIKGISSVLYADNEYAFSVIKVKDLNKLKLVANFSEKKTSQEIIEGGACKYLINAGFYSKEFTPLGLFVAEGKVLKKQDINATFNGFFTIDQEGWAQIGNLPPAVPLKYALQTGPILIQSSNPQKLALKNDENARRMILAMDNTRQVYFVAVYNGDSVFSGPLLVNLPLITQEIEKQLNTDYVAAINLDGGTASAFWGEGVTLKELSPIGSYFCIN